MGVGASEIFAPLPFRRDAGGAEAPDCAILRLRLLFGVAAFRPGPLLVVPLLDGGAPVEKSGRQRLFSGVLSGP